MHGTYLLIAVTLLGHLLALSHSSLPTTIPSATTGSQCSEYSAIKSDFTPAISEAITTNINPMLNTKYGRVCNCGGEGWTRVVDINMSDPNHRCPSNWRLYNSKGIRGCRRRSTHNSCDSAVFPVGQSYSRVCGKVNAYQLGDPDAFDNALGGSNSIEQPYVDGISVTYGASGSRKHIWTFVSADNFTGIWSSHTCPCTFKDSPWPHQLPSFLGNNYFCETGRNTHDLDITTPYPNLLWDGTGCTDPDSCCEFSNPPWFCVSLPEPTSEAMEVRLCLNNHSSNEDLIVTFADIYVR